MQVTSTEASTEAVTAEAEREVAGVEPAGGTRR